MKRAGIEPALPFAKRWLVAFLGLLRRLRAALHAAVRLRGRSRRVGLGGQALPRAGLRAGRAAGRGARARLAGRRRASRRRVLVGLGRARLLVHALVLVLALAVFRRTLLLGL